LLLNAGQQSTFGFELDTFISPIDPLVFTFALTYLDAQFDDFVLPNGIGDLSGETVDGISPFSISTSATYTHEFSGGAQLIGRVDYSHESNVATGNFLPGFFDTAAADPLAPAIAAADQFRREVNLVNASLTLKLNNGLELSAYARNLLDEEFITTVFDGVAQGGTVSGYPNAPRTYGGTVRFRF